MKKLRIFVFLLSVLLSFVAVQRKAYAARYFKTAGGDISSNGKLEIGNGNLPSPLYLSGKDTTIGDSGVILHKDSTPKVADGSESSPDPSHTDWITKLSSTNLVSNELGKYTYSYFMSKLTTTPIAPVLLSKDYCLSTVTSGFYSYAGNPNDFDPNYLWLKCGPSPTNITIPDGIKIVILADEDVIIRDNITVAPGGFFMVVSTDAIKVHSSVDKVEGAYIAGIQFATAYDVPTGLTANFLNARGIFVTHDKLDLWRKDNGGVDPDSKLGEAFTFDPSLILTVPRELYETSMDFTEVEP